MDLSNWGPVGTPDEIVAWLREFAERGVDHFICRFGALDQFARSSASPAKCCPQFQTERP